MALSGELQQLLPLVDYRTAERLGSVAGQVWAGRNLLLYLSKAELLTSLLDSSHQARTVNMDPPDPVLDFTARQILPGKLAMPVYSSQPLPAEVDRPPILQAEFVQPASGPLLTADRSREAAQWRSLSSLSSQEHSLFSLSSPEHKESNSEESNSKELEDSISTALRA